MTFRMKNIEWGAVSKYRGEMMGIAIIMIVLFHTQLPQTDAFFGLKRPFRDYEVDRAKV